MQEDDPRGGEGGERSCAERASEGTARQPYSDRGYDWEAIKHEVIHSDWSFNRIAEKFGPHASTIRARAKKEGWIRLIGTVPLTPGRKPALPDTARGRPKAAESRRRNLALRLFKIIDAKLQEIETRMHRPEGEGATPPSAAETERDVRSASSLTGLYTKLVELEEAARKDKEGSQSAATMRSEDADQFRRELALRIERLNRARDA